jgi:hypothetical protein
MKRYVYLYFGGRPPASPEEGQKLFAAWQAYMARMGERMVDGAPLGPHRVVGGDTTGHAHGFGIVQAASLDEAVSWTQDHPHLLMGGRVEVSEIQPIPT